MILPLELVFNALIGYSIFETIRVLKMSVSHIHLFMGNVERTRPRLYYSPIYHLKFDSFWRPKLSRKGLSTLFYFFELSFRATKQEEGDGNDNGSCGMPDRKKYSKLIFASASRV